MPQGLVEDRHMLLADGRQIVGGHRADHDQGPSVIHMHPRFRLIALANRPGYAPGCAQWVGACEFWGGVGQARRWAGAP